MVREKGLDKFLDFGSGLPTRGNVHEVVCALNPEAKVIYSDKDSLTVAIGKEILGDAPNMCYIYCAVEESCTLLDSEVVTDMFGTDRRIGVSMIGAFLYVPDEPLAQFFATLHEWVDKGSHIAVTCARKKVKEVKGVEKTARRIGLNFYSRSAEETLELIKPWELIEPGLVPGFYWGLPDNAPEINAQIQEHSYSFVACK